MKLFSSKVKVTDFKVGDRVELINAIGKSAKLGSRATVTRASAERKYLDVKWDRTGVHAAATQNDGGYYPEDFAFVKESLKAKTARMEERLAKLEARIADFERIIGNIHAITGETR